MAESEGNLQFSTPEVKVPFVADTESLKKAQDDFDTWIESVPDRITKALEPMLSGLKEALETATKLGEKLGENQSQQQGAGSSGGGGEKDDEELQRLDELVSQDELQLTEIRRIATTLDDLAVKLTELVDNSDG